MVRLTWLALFAMIAGSGCMKSKPRETVMDPTGAANTVSDTKPKPAANPEATPPRNGPDASGSRIVSTKGNLTSGIGSGAIGGSRAAAGRIVNNAELKDLHLGIFQAMQLDPGENPPGLDEVKGIVRQNSKLQALVGDEVVILTGSTNKNGVFAYTQWPQRGGNHYAVTRVGVEEMTPADLKARLMEQGSAIKLSK